MIKYVIIVSLVIYLLLLFILIINMRKKNAIIKYSFLLFTIIVFIALLLANENILDNIITSIIRYLYFPSIDAYLTTLCLVLGFLAYSIYNDYMYERIRITNYVFSILLIISYIMFMTLKVDISSYTKLYSNNSLICLRYATRTFTLWTLVILIRRGYDFILNKKRW